MLFNDVGLRSAQLICPESPNFLCVNPTDDLLSEGLMASETVAEKVRKNTEADKTIWIEGLRGIGSPEYLTNKRC